MYLFDIPDLPENTQNEWYSPAKYIEAARQVMGSIDLDPASCEHANHTVKAARYYTKEENGLVLPWYGNVWLNPPFQKPNMTNFTQKLIRSYQSGDITQATVLTLAGMQSQWYFQLLEYITCFCKGRSQFTGPQGEILGHRFGTNIFYLGPHTQQFKEHFSPFGPIMQKC